MTEQSRPRLRAAERINRLKKACAYGRVDFEAVQQKMKHGEYQFHEAGNACALTHIGVSGAYRTLYVDTVSGDILDVPALTALVEDFGRAMKCQVIETDGRLGWDRYFRQTSKAQGYRKVAVKYRKDL
jgi:hypothetical protein